MNIDFKAKDIKATILSYIKSKVPIFILRLMKWRRTSSLYPNWTGMFEFIYFLCKEIKIILKYSELFRSRFSRRILRTKAFTRKDGRLRWPIVPRFFNNWAEVKKFKITPLKRFPTTGVEKVLSTNYNSGFEVFVSFSFPFPFSSIFFFEHLEMNYSVFF